MQDNHSPWASIPAAGPMLRPKVAAEFLGLSVSQYYALAAEGSLPPPIRIGAQATAVPRDWLNAVIAARAGDVA